VVSYVSEKPAYDSIQGLTFSTMTDQDRLETRKSWDYRDVLSSFVVLLIILAAYLFFTG
jgi:SSS family solute:Na+ symporter